MSGQYEITVSKAVPKYSDRCFFPQSVLSEILDQNATLPHPLVFRLTNKEGQSTLVGVREFTAPEYHILVPEEVSLLIGQGVVTIELVEMPKATFLQVKPLQFYPQVTNWKYYLESFLSKNYTTLSKNQTFGYWDDVANTAVELVVEDTNEESVVVVDTDIVLDVLPLNDIMAAQQLEQAKTMEALENIPILEPILILDLEPFNKAAVPQIFKVNVLNYKSKICIEIQGEDIANMDILGGIDKFITLDCFLWCTMTQDDQEIKRLVVDLSSDTVANFVQKNGDQTECYIYLVFFAWEHNTRVKVKVFEGKSAEEVTAATHQTNSVEQVQCPNCSAYISKANIQLHEVACRRKKKCICGELFMGNIPLAHWHCDVCGPSVHGNSSLYKMKHQKIFHQHPYQCDKCSLETEFNNFIELVSKHKATECPQKLHECIFCHMILPQGEATYQDKFNNLTHHESECGSKTTECFECGKVLKTRDMTSHMKMHYMDKKEKSTLVVKHCSNTVCVSIFEDGSDASNELGLCDTCYRPLYASVHDPTGSKLRNRIERKYIMQLTKGCANAWCDNPECGTGGTKLDIKLALLRVQGLMAQIHSLPNNSNSPGSENRFYFCISENIARRKTLLKKLLEENISESLAYRAVWKSVDEESVRSWVNQNSIVF